MPLGKLALRPGIDRQSSQQAGEGGWWQANRVRFRAGWPEKMGGWRRLSSDELNGRVRAITTWSLLSGEPMIAAGSHTNLYLYQGGLVVDVTPIDRTRSVVDGIDVTDGSSAVTIEFTAAHGAAAGDVLTFDALSGVDRTPASLVVGGIDLSGDLMVAAVSSATAVVVEAGSAATATVAGGGGSQTASFFLSPGLADFVLGRGWSAGTYSRDAYGEPAQAGGILLPPRVWSLDAWGEVLLASPSDGGLYSWGPDVNGLIDARAARVVASVAADGPPLRIGAMLVAMPQRQVLLLGSSDLNATTGYDRMLLRWSDIEDYTLYRAAADNAAGSVRLQGGSRIVAGFNTQLQTLVWTDTALHGLRFIGQPLIYRVDVLGRACGLVGPKAFAELLGAVYWMGWGNFFVWRGGAAEPLPCAVWDDVFGDLNREQVGKVVCAGNSDFGEVMWFYPAGDSLEPNRYVAFNVVDRVWYGGTLTRTAWHDKGVFPRPLAVCWNSRVLFEHETGVDADGQPMGEWIESGWIDIEDGEWMTFLDRLLPDWRRLEGSVDLTVRVANHPQDTPRVYGPYRVASGTQQVVVRARGRQMSLRIDGMASPGGTWRLGALRTKAQPDGKVA